MDRQHTRATTDDDGDLLDRFPRIERATTQLERSFGPSCLLSMVMTVMLLLLVKRYLRVSWTGTAIIAVIIWFAVLALLVRWKPDQVVDEDD